MFAFRDKRGAVELAFTDRLGGVSAGPFAELDLAQPQDPETSLTSGAQHEQHHTISENWDLVRDAMARAGAKAPTDLPRVVLMRQVHGAHVAVVDDPVPSEPPTADALVTAVPRLLLASRAADCVPVLLADAERGVVGAVHAGRKGVAANVVGAALETMGELGAQQVVAWIGPHACGRCYEVPATMRDEVEALVPQARSETSWGTPALDLGAGVAAQLHHSSRVSEVVSVDRCTIEDDQLYSYRRDGTLAGRHAGLIWMRP